MGDQYIIPCPAGDDWTPLADVPVELARSRQIKGRVFRKHILNKGPLIHPTTGAKINIDDAFVQNMRQNFDRGVCDIVQVPLANAANKHSEAPVDNIGEVVGIEDTGSKVYALIDARDHADKLGKTMLGASAFLSTDYTDTTTGQKAGPTLLHVAVTNRPYVTGLDDYEEVLAATADDETDGEAVILTPEETADMTKDEMLAALKEQHGIDVEALQGATGREDGVHQLTAALTQALTGNQNLQLAAGQVSTEDIVGAVAELAQLSNAQGEQIAALHHDKAEHLVDGYIHAGRLLPKSREEAIEMALANPAKLDSFLAPANDPYVKLSHQEGLTGETSEGHTQDVEAEVARLTGTGHSAHMFSPNGAAHN